MQQAIVCRWDGMVTGREMAGMQLMQDLGAFYEKAVADGRVAGFEWYLSEQGAEGLFIARGDEEQLAALTASGEFRTFVVRSELCARNFGWARFATGEAAVATAALQGQEVARLG
jgi:hypothetical protein